MSDYEDPEFDPEELMNDLRTSNAQRMQKLASEGFQMDPITLLRLRLDVVSMMILEGDLARAIQLEITYESALADVFTDVESQINRAKLTAGLGGVQMSLADLRGGQ